MQILAIVVSLAVTLVAVALFGKTIGHIVSVIKLGQPAGRTNDPGKRTVTLAKESLGHTRMLQWSHIGVMHWFVAFGFIGLFLTLVTAFGQLFDPHWALPVIGHWFVFEWVSEALTWTGLVSIVGLIVYRLMHLPTGDKPRSSRFYGSTSWQAYYVEYTILGVLICILLLRGLEYQLGEGSKFHYPGTFFLGGLFGGLSQGGLENAVYLIAMIKILISFAWMITISLNATMGVAWHRFTAWPNIWFKRKPGSEGGGLALGALQPIMVNG
ncbi:MAG TPA: Fe-S oxidoreductase, partial [Kribbella sp.]